ncbi:hypothetical protein ACKWRH_28735 [Bradyrhizobium sp. Pa8]|uniref:hypothetical protein n=1 Tax=Bradyrhizobium sp. Pa8 TaxID=3386552 RepID=UPI00403F0084
MALRSVVEEREPAYVSTGHLPDADTVQSLVMLIVNVYERPRRGKSAATALPAVPSRWSDLLSHGIGWLTFAWTPAARAA